MGGVQSVPTDMSQTVRVISAGYSHTGTASMQVALTKLLKGPVIHGGTLFLRGSDACCKLWINAYDAKHRGDREATLKYVGEATRGYVGTADYPTLDFIPEMMELYPEARVVLVGRDPVKWIWSMATVGRKVSLWWLPYTMWPVPGWRMFPRFIREATRSAEAVRGGKDWAPDILMVWNDYVRSIVPKEKLLEMELEQGWGPLCEFLGLPVPDEPFPRVNDAEAVERYARYVFRTLALVWSGIFLVLGAAAYLALEHRHRVHTTFQVFRA